MKETELSDGKHKWYISQIFISWWSIQHKFL